MDLLDFIEMAEPRTEKEIEEHFEILKQFAKKHGNYYGLRKESLPNEVIPYLLDFEERNWIALYSKRTGISIRDDLRNWHTPDEAAEIVLEEVEEAYLQGNYQKAVGSRFHPMVNFPSRELQSQYWELKGKVFDSFARKLVQEQKALSYFLENESARGTKMNFFSERLEKEVIKVASEEISLIKDYDEMKHYFKTHAFFCDLPKRTYRPEIKVPLINRLDLAALCEATTFKDIFLILSYVGGSWTSLNGEYQIVYPPGWNFMRIFEETSTPEAVAVIESEMKRLKRLHS